STRSCAPNRGRTACRRRIDSSCRSTRISNSFARSHRPTSTINSSRRQTTTYSADTNKGGLQEDGERPTLPSPQEPSSLTRPGFCTPRPQLDRAAIQGAVVPVERRRGGLPLGAEGPHHSACTTSHRSP